MPKMRDEKRDEAQQMYLKSNGAMTAKEIALALGKNDSLVRKWKRLDEWEKKLEEQNKPKRGGQPGNKNAKGHGAPQGNKNAEKHGIYAAVNMESLNEAQAAAVKTAQAYSVIDSIKEQYLKLVAKREELQGMIERLNEEEGSLTGKDKLYLDSVTEMLVPKSKDDLIEDEIKEEAARAQEIYIEDANVFVSPAWVTNKKEKLQMKVTNQSSAFSRRMKIEAELSKVNRSIIKILDTMKAHELETKRMVLEEKKYNLALIRMTGEFEAGEEDEEDTDFLEDVQEG